MKILIVSHGRSGSQSLGLALSHITGHDEIIEPFNPALYDSYPIETGASIPEDTIIRTLSVHESNFSIKRADDFDRVIILARKNFYDNVLSAESAMEHGYSTTYSGEEEPDFVANTAMYQAGQYALLFNVLNEVDTCKLVWYEDIFSDYDKSYQTLQTLDIEMTEEQFGEVWDAHLNPIHRYKQVS